MKTQPQEINIEGLRLTRKIPETNFEKQLLLDWIKSRFTEYTWMDGDVVRPRTLDLSGVVSQQNLEENEMHNSWGGEDIQSGWFVGYMTFRGDGSPLTMLQEKQINIRWAVCEDQRGRPVLVYWTEDSGVCVGDAPYAATPN